MSANGDSDAADPIDPPTTLGPDPDAPAETIALPAGALESGCYIEGVGTHEQTALLQSWCVEWAEAGDGFCYVHPTGPEPFDLLARLPADRLEDVVWIDVDRRGLPSSLDIPWLKRVTIDLFDVPRRDHDTFTLDPVDFRVNTYLDALSEHPDFDWNIARVLSTMLPTHFVRDDLAFGDGQAHALTELASLQDASDEYGLTPEEHRDVEIARYAVTGALDREVSPARDAGDILGWVHDPTPTNPLLDGTSYDVGDALSAGADPIVLVTGNLAASDAAARLRTHLLVAALCCRLREAAIIDPGRETTFPIVVDGVGELAVGEGELFQRLLREADELPLAPVLSGPPTKALANPVALAISEHVDTRIVVATTDSATRDRTDDAVALRSALRTGSLDAVEHYLDQEFSGAVADAALCWLRTGTAGRLADASDVQQSMQPALVPEMPEPRHDPGVVAEAITRSVDRHGTEPAYLTAEMKATARDRVQNRDRRR